MTKFFIVLVLFLAVPHLLSKLLRINNLIPLVFLQLMLGVLAKMSGFLEWLSARDINIINGPLPSALEGLGWLGVTLLVAQTAGESMPAQGQARRQIATISLVGFLATCIIGATLGYAVAVSYPQLIGSLQQPVLFATGVGIALSVTALPVLMAIVRQGGLSNHPVARLAINCSILDDLWLWLGMAGVLAFATAGSTSPLYIVGYLTIYLACMTLLVKPALHKWYANPANSERNGLMVALSVILVSAAVTGMMGIHSIFGAFVAGAVLPRQALAAGRETLQQLTYILLLPPFFIMTGTRLSVDIGSPFFIQLALLVTLFAVVGKMSAAALAGRITGLSWRDSFALGGLMQCKGLMELIAINILLEANVIGQEMFSALAVMALVSTFVTLPLTRVLLTREPALPECAVKAREHFSGVV